MFKTRSHYFYSERCKGVGLKEDATLFRKWHEAYLKTVTVL
jgi:hypothetical protein